MEQQSILCLAAQIHAEYLCAEQGVRKCTLLRVCIQIQFSGDQNTLIEQSAVLNYSNRTFTAILRNSL